MNPIRKMLGLSILVLVLASWQVEASPPKDPIASLFLPKESESSGSESKSCHPTPAPSFTMGNGPDFEMTLRCEVRCQGSNTQSFLTSANFSPVAEDLTPRNGGFLSPMTLAIQSVAARSCLKRAVEACGSLRSVADFRATGAESGAWSALLPIGCEAEKGNVVSPYDKSFREKLMPRGPDPVDGNAATRPIALRVPELVSTGRFTRDPVPGHLPGSLVECKSPIRAGICFGDCMTDLPGKEWAVLLASNTPSVITDFSICGDEFLEELRQNPDVAKASLPVREHFCREYFWRSVRKHDRGTGPTSCSALRGEVDCASFFKAAGLSGL